MGWLSSSKSTSTNNQFDQRQGADNGSLVTKDGTINYSSDTPEAFEVANNAIVNQKDSLKIIADFASDSLASSINAIDNSAKRVQDQATSSLNFADNVTRSDSTSLISKFLSFTPWLVVGGGVLLYYGFKK